MINIAEIKIALETAQRCRRNWDLSKTIPQEHIDLLKYSVINSPAKQNEEYYSVTFITDRNTIEQIYNHTNRNSELIIQDLSKNPQVLANLLVAFCKRKPNTFRNDASEYESDIVMDANRNIAIGIASGQLALTAAMLNYSTGFCICFNNIIIGNIIEDTPLLLLGIGYPDETRDRTENQNSIAKFNSFNKPITINDISIKGKAQYRLSGDATSKKFTVELTFNSPDNLAVTTIGKEWMYRAGLDEDSIKDLIYTMEEISKNTGINNPHVYLDTVGNSIKYVWTDNDLDKLNSIKDYVLKLPSIVTFINDITNKGWTVE